MLKIDISYENTASATIATLLAINIFFPNPFINRQNPKLKSSIVVVLLFISFSIVSYLTIGPAINWGNIEIYNNKLKKFFCTLALFITMSNIYDIIWNVKNDIPIGKAILTIRLSLPVSQAMFSVINVRYLNIISNNILYIVTIDASNFLLFQCFSINSPNIQFIKTENIITNTNVGSPQA